MRFADRPLDNEALRAMAQARFPAEEDYVSEINPGAEALVRRSRALLRRGRSCSIDYGFPQAEYYHPQRSAGTLVGHYRHRVHDDPFLWPACRTSPRMSTSPAIAMAGTSRGCGRGLCVAGGVPHGFGDPRSLAAGGVPESVAYIRAAAAVQRLLSPAEMGELFKVLVLSRETMVSFGVILPGTDRSHRL